MLKIPFGINIDTGELTEVSNVPGGRACKCVCYDCGQGLLARQGEIKEWHFSHDPSTEHKPHKACEISFYSACRQYLIHRLTTKDHFSLLTPAYSVFATNSIGWDIIESAVVTDSKKLLPSAYLESIVFDLEVEVDHHKLNMIFLYPDRIEPECESGAAVLAMDLNYILKQYVTQRSSQPDVIMEIARRWFEHEIEGKRWLSHPREPLVRDKLKLRVQNKQDKFQKNSSFKDEAPEYLWGNFTCIKCGLYWRGHRDRDSKCPECKTHLYSSFKKTDQLS